MTAACPHSRVVEQLPTAAVSLAVDAALTHLVTIGERVTAPRRRVLELLLASGEPVKAYDLIAAFHANKRLAKPATVYRALAFLERVGLVHRLLSLKSYVACKLGTAAHTAAFVICDCCSSCREIISPDAALLTGTANALGYSIDRVTLEVVGKCPACRVTIGG